MACFVISRAFIAAAGVLIAGSALAESTAPVVQPNFFPDVQAQEAAWTLSVSDAKPEV